MLSKRPWWLLACWLCLGLSLATQGADSLQWNQGKDRLTVDVRKLPLADLLKQVADQTGWQVYLEPGTTHSSSVKFKDLPSGEGLRLLLGDLNFALIPQTNASPRLYVFRTDMGKATERITAAKKKIGSKARRMPNELLVQLKPGMSIDELARQFGAKVIGRIPELNLYRLQFEDAEAAEAAKDNLVSNVTVDAVDYNYSMDQPVAPLAVSGVSASTPKLRLNPPPASGQVIVGLVDTEVQSLGELDKFVTKKLSVTDGSAPPREGTPTHGTTMLWDMLSTLSSVTEGSTSVQFISVNVFGADGMATTFDVASGAVLAINNGATMINLSLGSPGNSTVLENVIKQLSARGIGMVAASGNEPTGEPFYPAAYDEVMAVTATQNGKIAPYANVWPGVEVAAPGTSLMSYGGKTYYSQGTSVSAAYVTGLAAGLSQAQAKTWAQIQETVRSRLAVPPK